jgi:mRNA-degrading endonuclease RelE of RelBE toxin-antitoxin system
MYELKAIGAVQKDLNALNRGTVKEIRDIHFPRIKQDPRQADPLGYAFKGLYSYHFRHAGSAYRIIYEIYEEENLVIVLLIGSRGNFYERLRRRLRR